MKTISFCTLACAFFLAGQAMAQNATQQPQTAAPATGGNAAPPSAAPASPQTAPSAQPSAKTPAPIVGATHYEGWYTFNGDLKAQKYSTPPRSRRKMSASYRRPGRSTPATYPTAAASMPASDWSATPLFVNNTVYVATPFYRIFALEPGHRQGQVDLRHPCGAEGGNAAGSENARRCLLAVRGPAGRAALPEDRLYRNDGRKAPCRGCRYRQAMRRLCRRWRARHQPMEQDQRQVAALDPAAADRLQGHAVHRLGRQGLGRCRSASRPRFRRRCADRQAEVDIRALPEEQAKTTGTPNVWTSMSVDREHGILYLPVSSPSPNYYGGNRNGEAAAGHLGHRARC